MIVLPTIAKLEVLTAWGPPGEHISGRVNLKWRVVIDLKNEVKSLFPEYPHPPAPSSLEIRKNNQTTLLLQTEICYVLKSNIIGNLALPGY